VTPRLRFLIGEHSSPKYVREIFRPLEWGRMWVFRTIRLYEGERWGFDNGAFKAFVDGEPWSESAYMKRLDAAHALGTPLLAVCPDKVGAGAESLATSAEWMSSGRLPDEWPWYLALQDGMTEDDVRPLLPMFSGIFMGGTREFKKEAPAWCRFAHLHRLPFHYGRASHVRRLEECESMGADTADSTQPLWQKDAPGNGMKQFVDWFSGRGQVVGKGLLCTG